MSALSVAQIAASPSCTEQELVAAVRRGSDRAFEELYSRYRSRIAAYIFGMVGDHARAEDIAQEVFISALRRLCNSEGAIAFKPWIYEIAKNACIDEFRRTRRVREVPLVMVSDEDGWGEERDLPSNSPAPDAAVESKQSLSDLRGAFHGLSENHHKVIVMRELEGLSYNQIGERLGMTRPVVESTLFRARKRLSEEYDELASGRRCSRVQTVIDTTEERALRKLGARERRQLARHLSHCQPCRRHARMASLDESFFQAPTTLVGKIAALLPFPLLRWRRGGGGSAAGGSHSAGAMRSLHSIARFIDPASIGPGRAAAVLAAVTVAGGGVATVVATQDGSSKPAPRFTPASSATNSSQHSVSTRPARAGASAHGSAAAHSAVSHGRGTARLHSGSHGSGLHSGSHGSGLAGSTVKALPGGRMPAEHGTQSAPGAGTTAASSSATSTPVGAAYHSATVPVVSSAAHTVNGLVPQSAKEAVDGVVKKVTGVVSTTASSLPSPATTTTAVPNLPPPQLPQAPPPQKSPNLLGK